MLKKGFSRATFIVALVAVMMSAQRVNSESVFTPQDPLRSQQFRATLLGLAQPTPPVPTVATLRHLEASADTVETFDVQIEEEKGPGLVREIAIAAVVAAAVGYAAYELFKSDDSGNKTVPPGKEPPSGARAAFLTIPFTRSR